MRILSREELEDYQNCKGICHKCLLEKYIRGQGIGCFQFLGQRYEELKKLYTDVVKQNIKYSPMIGESDMKPLGQNEKPSGERPEPPCREPSNYTCASCEKDFSMGSDYCLLCSIGWKGVGNFVRWIPKKEKEKHHVIANNKESVRKYQTESLQKLIDVELVFANQQFPAFTSAMEGLGVIQEEYDEAMEEIESIQYWFNLFKKELRTESPNTTFFKIEMSVRIERTILELIQVSAMLNKFSNIK